MSAASTLDGSSPGHGHRQPFANGHPDVTTAPRPVRGGANGSSSSRLSAGSKGSRNSGRLTVTDLVESDPDAPSKSLKRKASPERSSNDYSSPAYPNEHAAPSSKQNRASASASPALSALLNGPSPPLRPTQGSPIANPPPALTPPTSNASLHNPPPPPTTAITTLSPPQPKAVAEIAKASSTTSKRAVASATSAPASPKPSTARAVAVSKTGPTAGTGGGLLAGTFGDVALGDEDPIASIPTVVLQISLNGETNKYIDVSKMAEDKYGWAALNPRLARQKLRLGQDASGDEAMMDASESESAVEEKMGGLSDAGLSGPGGPGGPGGEVKPKRKKRRADEGYDANDLFIDDSELLLEEQAAAAKDGFFVYSGPLVPEGERPQIERINGGPPKRGRGRGGRGAGTGRGGGSAGKSTAPRKPRVTKALKEKMEKEKEEREKTALNMAAVAARQQHVQAAPRSIPA
ncbi:hypothetical protein Dda_2325 [Drechslerella dactyloides]|uniref:Hpc2-related domain-containing protein n=1 Tax=Drechslerella dactyloides TaxID=74499 RepID=A0AAD6NM83_DREDA|nr:hypothetical protein Dda_2325 [Drechslerella dactyloides]